MFWNIGKLANHSSGLAAVALIMYKSRGFDVS